MIAGGKWIIYDRFVPDKPELTGDYWAMAEEKDFARCLFDGNVVPRFKAIRESKGNLAVLDLLIVD
ncbi:hypothetical protein P280DRAFT_548778 [Massarina eburnea CBS 473.64]|uniref:Uncharacterized protein n=1 Tax=Massarina eburnea CBS 473.64 TaxID=1395130 RepID=A0A6A6S573_9PLEO|nr:hypothetical protein P280DRAFT_548778 [Massarina eburnea CBS 473.64]